MRSKKHENELFFGKFTLLNANQVSTKFMYLWIGPLNYTLLLLSSWEINKNITKLSLLYVSKKVWHRNIWFLFKSKRYSFLSLSNNNTEKVTIITF